MPALNQTNYSLSGIMPVVPSFDFLELAQIEIPAAWEYMEAMYVYEAEIRPIAHDWSVRLGAEIWERKKPWYCYL